MTINRMKTILSFLVTAFACSALTACGGSGSERAGIEAMVQTTYMTSSTANGEVDAEADPAGEEASIKTIYRDDNMLIELQLGLVNLRAVALVKCESIAVATARHLLDFMVPAAQAHSAHIPSGPAGVIDVLKPDLLVWDLGQLQPAAGRYCGLKLEIANVHASHDEGHGDEGEHHSMGGAGEVEMSGDAETAGLNMGGKAVLVSPCYYPDTAGSPQTPLDNTFPHSCIEAAYRGEALTHSVMFAEPVTLNAERRAVHLMLATAYDNWFNGLDMTILASDSDEQAKLAQNVLESFYLHSAE